MGGNQINRVFIQKAKKVNETMILSFWKCLAGRGKKKKKKLVDYGVGGSFDKSLGRSFLKKAVVMDSFQATVKAHIP
ncbi:hypothetical protein Csa_020667 [Cucumis sativus]|uniref:Uncharacterized protein n=1 Tax=Cucumis sativus TaxID=3659 RepID=A0A0A0KC29_CUCSA|nr:hypothetical protein Csa_020667 [Cucumis sativus]